MATLNVTARVCPAVQLNPVRLFAVREKNPCGVKTFPVVEPVSMMSADCDMPFAVDAVLFDGQQATPFNVIP